MTMSILIYSELRVTPLSSNCSEGLDSVRCGVFKYFISFAQYSCNDKHTFTVIILLLGKRTAGKNNPLSLLLMMLFSKREKNFTLSLVASHKLLEINLRILTIVGPFKSAAFQLSNINIKKSSVLHDTV